ncbi:MAG: hypothetical protein M3P96_06275 [Actinomycetota bacterium]|nr:hypothetical protein [Actinomycetota bacterium]
MAASRRRRVLTVLTLVEVAALVGVLAGYLIAVAAALRRISRTLGKVTFGVRAIESQTRPVGPALAAVAEDLEAVAGVLGAASPDRSAQSVPRPPR